MTGSGANLIAGSGGLRYANSPYGDCDVLEDFCPDKPVSSIDCSP
jgi:hypothetical protein